MTWLGHSSGGPTSRLRCMCAAFVVGCWYARVWSGVCSVVAGNAGGTHPHCVYTGMHCRARGVLSCDDDEEEIYDESWSSVHTP
jgi:hypothetical protein